MALDTSSARKDVPAVLDGPQHVAIIMDGNGRWAKRQGKPRLEGHKAGISRIRRALRALARHKVRYVTIYAFSTENWGRPQDEVEGLLELLNLVIREEVQKLHEEHVRILHMGGRDRLPASTVREIEHAIELTANNDGPTLCVAFNYGGRAEIVEAVQQIVQSGVPAEQITEQTIRQHLCLPDIPDPDLIIRTAGEQRLSNFLIWQSAYSEIYYTSTPWPDFDDAEVEKALDAYRQRRRRYGKLRSET